MPKVQNLSGKGVPLLRWRVLPDGRVLSPKGVLGDKLPDDVGYSDQAKRLANLGVLKIEGFNWFPAEPVKPKPAPDPAVPDAQPQPARDDLTTLVHIGTGRARKLATVGITTFAGVVEAGADALCAALDIGSDLAAEIVAAAKKKA